MKTLSIIVLPLLIAQVDLSLADNTIVIDGVAYEQCTAKEIRFYDRMGWDSFECHADKAWLADAFDLEACGVTPDDDMEVSYGKLSRCTINEVKQK